MAEMVTIELFDPPDWHGAKVERLEIKEPTGGLFAELGEPRIYVRSADGAGYWVEQTSIIARYVDACVKHEGGKDLLRHMSLTDVTQVKDTILGFFIAARERILTRKLERSATT